MDLQPGLAAGQRQDGAKLCKRNRAISAKFGHLRPCLTNPHRVRTTLVRPIQQFLGSRLLSRSRSFVGRRNKAVDTPPT
jgi:hypothetical protein